MVKAILLGLLLSTTAAANTPNCLELMQKSIIDYKAEGYDLIGEQKSRDGYGTCGAFASQSGDVKIECLVDVRGLDFFNQAMRMGNTGVSKKAECSYEGNNYHIYVLTLPEA